MNEERNDLPATHQQEHVQTLVCHHCAGAGVVDFGPHRGEICCHCAGQGRCEESSGSASCCAGAFGAGYNG